MNGENASTFDLSKMDKEHLEIDERMKKREEEGLKNTLKYFDRIHDKLFTFNNILIAGYYIISKLDKTVHVLSILIPIANLAFLIFIEYRMMEKSRFESEITQKRPTEIKKWSRGIKKTTMYSFYTILSTLFVTGIFLYHLIK